MGQSIRDAGNLWLAKALWDLGAVQFGDFTLGRTTLHSPVHVNLRLLISDPPAPARAARGGGAGDERGGADAAEDAARARAAVPAGGGDTVRGAAPGDGVFAAEPGAADLHPPGGGQ